MVSGIKQEIVGSQPRRCGQYLLKLGIGKILNHNLARSEISRRDTFPTARLERSSTHPPRGLRQVLPRLARSYRYDANVQGLAPKSTYSGPSLQLQ